MINLLKVILPLFIGFSSQISFCQDTAKHTFEVKKIYATAAGSTGGNIDRYVLADSAEIIIHGCTGCKIEGFKMTGKIKYSVEDNFIEREKGTTGKDSILDIGTKYLNHTLYSDTTLFTYYMEEFVRNNKLGFSTYYIEIYDIKVITPAGEELTLDKICLYLQ